MRGETWRARGVEGTGPDRQARYGRDVEGGGVDVGR